MGRLAGPGRAKEQVASGGWVGQLERARQECSLGMGMAVSYRTFVKNVLTSSGRLMAVF